MYLLDTMHGKNGLCRNLMQQLTNIAEHYQILSQWKDHLKQCCKVYIIWGKYKGTGLAKIKFNGNAVRNINKNIHSIYKCDGKHKNIEMQLPSHYDFFQDVRRSLYKIESIQAINEL